MVRKNQVQIVLDYLREHEKGVTSMYAFWRWRITRLSDKIFRLRNKGYHIVTIREKNKFIPGYHGRYVLLEENDWWV